MSRYSDQVREQRETERARQSRAENSGTPAERAREIADRAREARERAQWRAFDRAERRQQQRARSR
jgi:hypothetical protein